jgi:hypothetical protein
MFRSFYLYRVSRPIASSVKRQVSAAREISARLASIAVTIAFASRRIDKTSLTGPAYVNLGPTGRCK